MNFSFFNIFIPILDQSSLLKTFTWRGNYFSCISILQLKTSKRFSCIGWGEVSCSMKKVRPALANTSCNSHISAKKRIRFCMKEEQMDNKDTSPACYLLALSWKIFLLSVTQNPYFILVTMCIMEKCYRYRPSRSFCITWVVSTHLYLCMQTPSLPFLPFS